MKNVYKKLIVAGLLCFVFSVELPDEPRPRIAFMSRAEAIVGAPLTPVSVAGVARRTTRRVVATEAAVATTAAAAGSQQAQATGEQQAATAQQQAAVAQQQQAATAQQQAGPSGSQPIGTVVQTLPTGCASVVFAGVNYSDCAGVFYKAAFQGNNLVYVVVEKPTN